MRLVKSQNQNERDLKRLSAHANHPETDPVKALKREEFKRTLTQYEIGLEP